MQQSLRAAVLSIVVVCAMGVHAQEQKAALPASVARFKLPSSGLEWRAPVHPLKFFDATGRRAGVFGKQTGHYEAWIYPIKVLHGFRLEFRREGMPEPVRGEAYLEEIVARPESTTLVYVHPLFTVRQIIWTPRDEPAIVNFFEVDSDKPLVITAKFVPDFKPMWPASLGGQYSYWLADEKAFGLTDATSKPTAIIGSPATGAFTEHMDHALVGGEMLLQLRVTPEEARKTLPSMVMALDMESSAKARAVYRRVLGQLRELYEARVAYHKDFLARTLQIETPDAELNRAFEWAKVSIDAGWVCTPTKFSEGCGLVAGYGPSGDSERPGFAWWFGGDALMASWAMLDYGDHEGALQVLRFLRARQRADGKMMHEMTQSVDLVDWFGKYGFAYYHADTTPMYIYSVAEYWRRTGDRDFLQQFWPSVKKAYEWCLTTVDPADGLMDNTKAGLAAVEVGPLRGRVTKDIYLQGFWLAALGGMHDLASAIGDIEVSSNAALRHKGARAAIDQGWWNSGGEFLDFGVAGDGVRANRLGNWPAALLALGNGPSGLVSEGRIAAGVFARPELATDWGTRWLSNRDPLYDPVSYNNGTVWPFINGLVAWAQFAWTRPQEAFVTWSSIASLTGVQSPGALPEHMNGDRNRPGERSVPHQLFSSVGVILPAVRGLLGFETDFAKDPGRPELFLALALPAQWQSVRFARLRLGPASISGEVRNSNQKWTLALQNAGALAPVVHADALLPMAADVTEVLLNGIKANDNQKTIFDELVTTRVRLFAADLPGKLALEVKYSGGIGVVPPEVRPQPGARTQSLRILDIDYYETLRPGEMQLRLAGLGMRTYTLDLVTPKAKLTVEGATLRKTKQGYRLEIAFEGPEGEYVTKVIKVKW